MIAILPGSVWLLHFQSGEATGESPQAITVVGHEVYAGEPFVIVKDIRGNESHLAPSSFILRATSAGDRQVYAAPLDRLVACAVCNSSGTAKGKPHCATCGGSGWINGLPMIADAETQLATLRRAVRVYKAARHAGRDVQRTATMMYDIAGRGEA